MSGHRQLLLNNPIYCSEFPFEFRGVAVFWAAAPGWLQGWLETGGRPWRLLCHALRPLLGSTDARCCHDGKGWFWEAFFVEKGPNWAQV